MTAWEDLQSKLTKMVLQATDLRDSVKRDWAVTDGPTDLHENLIDHRKALDSLEVLVAQLVRARSQSDIEVRRAEDALEDAEASAGRLLEDFATAKEKNAHLATQTVEERVILRKARRRRDEVASAHDYTKALYWGLNGSRQDLSDRIRLITMQSSLER